MSSNMGETGRGLSAFSRSSHTTYKDYVLIRDKFVIALPMMSWFCTTIDSKTVDRRKLGSEWNLSFTVSTKFRQLMPMGKDSHASFSIPVQIDDYEGSLTYQTTLLEAFSMSWCRQSKSIFWKTSPIKTPPALRALSRKVRTWSWPHENGEYIGTICEYSKHRNLESE